jgi:hypothetical protein
MSKKPEPYKPEPFVDKLGRVIPESHFDNAIPPPDASDPPPEMKPLYDQMLERITGNKPKPKD